MSNKEGLPCMHCGLENPIFIHNVYHKKHGVRQLCTSCVLKKFSGAFCPICFKVYETEDSSNSSRNRAISCRFCPALAHFNCAAPALTSSSIVPSGHRYVCGSCSNPKFKFFDCRRDEKTGLACIDENMPLELLAASIISQRCMREAAIFCQQQVEIKAREAARAKQEAKKALEYLTELTMPNLSLNEEKGEPEEIGGEESKESEKSDEES